MSSHETSFDRVATCQAFPEKNIKRDQKTIKKLPKVCIMLFAFFEEAISTKADGRIHGGATVKTCQNMSKHVKTMAPQDQV